MANLTASVTSALGRVGRTLLGRGTRRDVPQGAQQHNEIRLGNKTQIIDIEFYQGRDPDGSLTGLVCWTSGYILTYPEDEVPQSHAVPSGVARVREGEMLVWRRSEPGVVRPTTFDEVARDKECVIIASVSRLTDISALVGPQNIKLPQSH